MLTYNSEEECCICLDTLNLNDSFLYFDCNHRIHTSCSELLQICPLCRAIKIDVATLTNLPNELVINIQEQEQQLQQQQQMEIRDQVNVINIQDGYYCQMNKYIVIRIALLFALMLFFVVKFAL